MLHNFSNQVYIYTQYITFTLLNTEYATELYKLLAAIQLKPELNSRSHMWCGSLHSFIEKKQKQIGNEPLISHCRVLKKISKALWELLKL